MAHRIQILLTTGQYDALNREAWRTGLPMAEIIRRLIDAALLPGRRILIGGWEISISIRRRGGVPRQARRPSKKLVG